jgi:hypothetical protein
MNNFGFTIRVARNELPWETRKIKLTNAEGVAAWLDPVAVTLRGKCSSYDFTQGSSFLANPGLDARIPLGLLLRRPSLSIYNPIYVDLEKAISRPGRFFSCPLKEGSAGKCRRMI